MEDETLGFFKKTSSSHARLNVPALVQVAALAIIMIRGLDVLMIFDKLGVRYWRVHSSQRTNLEFNAASF